MRTKGEETVSTSTKGQDAECFVFQGKIAVLPEVDRKIQERIRLWSKSERTVKWACVLTGEARFEEETLIPLVDNFFELPAFGLNEEHGLAFCLDDIRRIAENHYVIAMLQMNPSNVFPTSSDLAVALYVDLLLSRPILHIFTSPGGQKLILTFEKCHECEHSFFKLFQYEKKGR